MDTYRDTAINVYKEDAEIQNSWFKPDDLKKALMEMYCV